MVVILIVWCFIVKKSIVPMQVIKDILDFFCHHVTSIKLLSCCVLWQNKDLAMNASSLHAVFTFWCFDARPTLVIMLWLIVSEILTMLSVAIRSTPDLDSFKYCDIVVLAKWQHLPEEIPNCIRVCIKDCLQIFAWCLLHLNSLWIHLFPPMYSLGLLLFCILNSSEVENLKFVLI